MTFDLTRFPGYILSQYLKTSFDTNIDLSSFNLNLGDFGSARLVATLTPSSDGEQSSVAVILSNVNGEDSLLSIKCCLLQINENGGQMFQASFLRISYNSLYLSYQSETVNSQGSASSSNSTSVRFRLDQVDVTTFSLVVIPTVILVDNMKQVLVDSQQR